MTKKAEASARACEAARRVRRVARALKNARTQLQHIDTVMAKMTADGRPWKEFSAACKEYADALRAAKAASSSVKGEAIRKNVPTMGRSA